MVVVWVAAAVVVISFVDFIYNQSKLCMISGLHLYSSAM